jgi:rSAM/selenodomain-associated transferase 2
VTPARVSVVIPTLNEAGRIASRVGEAAAQGAWQVIVADGGSSDGTAELAPPPAVVVSAPRGRGAQMNAGAALATGEALLFLHADTRLPAGGVAAVGRAVAAGAPAGAFRLAFDHPSPLLAALAWLTRFSLPHSFYGDQAIFVRAELFRSLGGYADLGPLEDVELMRRLRRLGQPVRLPLTALTSARRFRARGVARQQALNVWLVARWLMGADPARLARRYRRGPRGWP